jgi:prepilin-type N-terminal cleavage/methylation domain-containing protein
MIEKQYSIAARTIRSGFTLVEMLVSMGVLVLLALFLTQLVNTAATTVRPANKHIDTDTEARTVFDRMAVDFAQMLKRADVDYYVKANSIKYPGHSGGHKKGGGGGGGGQTDLNDYMAFYTQAPGYSSNSRSPISLVAYRVNGLQLLNGAQNPAYNRLERRGEALLWNGQSLSGNVKTATAKPIFFLPVLIGDPNQGVWPSVGNNNTSATVDQPYMETIGPSVFRFEYCYLLKTGIATDTPWNIDSSYGPVYGTFNGLADVEAIGVTIAVIDAQNRALLVQGDPAENNILNLQLYMQDFRTAPGRGVGGNKSVLDMEYQWNQVITNPSTYPLTLNMPRAAISAIRIYSRTFDLKTL